ncbi:MAG: TonB-dependent siderophore receptor [Vicinamibacterales bacterium]
MHRRLHLILLCLVVAAPRTAAPQPPARIEGRVTDTSGAAIPGARVVLDGAGPERVTQTDGAGRFTFPPPAGDAVVTVSRDGFASVAIGVRAGDPPLAVVLGVAQREEAVVVRGAPETRTATKVPTPLRDIPQAIGVVNAEAMRQLAVSTMADVVRFVPGVGEAQGEGNRDAPVLRGNSTTADFYVDGIRDDVQYYRDVYNLAGVEVLKGPNAMVFGRGGGGGVINRVQRVADGTASREVRVQAGSFDGRRLTADINQPVSAAASVRLMGMYEESDSYRSGVGLERYGLTPAVTVRLGAATVLRAGGEHFHDRRTADRGVPSYEGRPVAVPPSTFFGNPDLSYATATVNSAYGQIERRLGARATLRSRLAVGDYDKFYQNVFPRSVTADGQSAVLGAYNNRTARRNAFSQTDVIVPASTGRVRHTVAFGTEFGRQATGNRRMTGYFPDAGGATSLAVPLARPTTALTTTFQPSTTDADNHVVATTAAVYLQDQAALTSTLAAVVGMRVERFATDLRAARAPVSLTTRDVVWSPRVGLVYTPHARLSVYASRGTSFLPRAGEQLSSLSASNQALDPETFRNLEAGLKWNLAGGASVTAAAYRSVRGNVAVTDPVDPTAVVLVDGQRVRGLEIGASGRITSRWSVLGGYAYQDGRITRSVSASALAGASLASLPAHSASLWNRLDVRPGVGVGVAAIYRGAVFASTDNTVTLPAFFRVDAGLFGRLPLGFDVQLNVENVFGRRYFQAAHGNNNITPGSPRAIRLAIGTRF